MYSRESLVRMNIMPLKQIATSLGINKSGKLKSELIDLIVEESYRVTQKDGLTLLRDRVRRQVDRPRQLVDPQEVPTQS